MKGYSNGYISNSGETFEGSEFMNIMITMDDSKDDHFNRPTMRPLGGWGEPGMIATGIKCTFSVIGNALTFIRECQSMLSLRHVSKQLQQLIYYGKSPLAVSETASESKSSDSCAVFPELWKELSHRYNESQIKAIKSISDSYDSLDSNVTLLQGPPGMI